MNTDETYLRDLISDAELRSSLDGIHKAVSDMWGGVRHDLPFVVAHFTDHGPEHLARVASRIRQLLGAYKNRPFDDLELYVMLCGLYLHDIGMQCDFAAHPEVIDRAVELRHSLGLSSEDLTLVAGVEEREQGVLARKYHNFLSAAWISTSREAGKGLLSAATLSIPDPVVNEVMDVCIYHTKIDIMSCPKRFVNYPNLRKRFVAAILRFADELDIDYSRVSPPEIADETGMPEENKAYWYLHSHMSVAFNEDILIIRISLNPQDEREYGRRIEDRYIRGFIRKNQACLDVLWPNGIRLRMDETSSRVTGSYGVQPIPEKYLKVLAGATGTSAGVEPSAPKAGSDVESEAKVVDLLYAGLNECETVDDFVALLVLVTKIGPRVPSFTREVDSIRSQAWSTLQLLTAEDPQRAGLIIVRDLLPLCLDVSSPDEGETTAAITRYRNRLAEWLYSYPIPAIKDVRHGMVNALVICLQTPLVKEACWALTGIGFREDTISEPLWDVASSDDPDVRDTALSTLARLAYGEVERDRLLAAIESALLRKDFSIPLWGALNSFPDPRLVPMLQSTWLAEQPEGSDAQKPRYGLGLLAGIANAFQEDAQLQRDAWKIVQNYAAHHFDDVVGRLYLGSDVTPRFDTRGVVLYLISLASADEAHSYRLDLVCRRLIECVRPSQIATWSELSAGYTGGLYRLYSATCEDTGEAFTSQTEKGMLKELAWEVLLRARFPNLVTSDYLADCILTESSWSLRGDGLDWESCFRIDPLPPRLVHLVTEVFDEPGPAIHEYPVRKGAAQVLCSAANKDAFEALLAFGYTVEGQVLAFSVEALSEVALHLAATDREWVQQRLLDVALTGGALRHRQVAIGALETLADAGQFDTDGIASLGQLLDDKSLPLASRARVLNVIGLLSESVVQADIFDRVVMWARSDEPDLNVKALMALARWSKLTAYPDLMESRLGLVRSDDGWQWIEGFVPDSGILEVIGVLYRSKPPGFAAPLAASLATLRPLTLQEALQVIRWAHRSSGESAAPHALWEAIVSLVTAGDTGFVPLADCILAMSELDHDRFSQFDWRPLCDNWDATIRQVLADALGENNNATVAAREAAFVRLVDLTRDGDYRVRRSSYRGLSRLDHARFDGLCLAWATGPEVALRQRAAEACVWLESKEKALGTLAELSADVEPGPREAAVRARDERRRNTWATMYLEQVTNAEDESNQSILDRWAYASALAAVGNDDTMRELRSFARSRQHAPHVTHWLRRLHAEIRRQWTDTIKSHPKRGIYWDGSLT
jgi:hypothetical protein